MGRQVSPNHAIFFLVLVLLVTSSCGMNHDVKNNIDPNEEQDYCKRVVCKGLHCSKVFVYKGRCMCVLKKGPQVTMPCS
ncbi:hypothetical protein LINPERHAP1_LOCUS35350 [Linum perenne]